MRNLPIMSILHFPAWPRPHCGTGTVIHTVREEDRQAAIQAAFRDPR